MNNDGQNLSIGDAASRFLADLPPTEKEITQQEVYKFIRWFGRDRAINTLTPAEIANYAEGLSLSDTDYVKKLGLVRTFLAYARKKEWSRTNLATHLKPKKQKAKTVTYSKQLPAEPVLLSQQKYDELQAEVAALKQKRLEVIEEMRKAAADKDFRENAPLQAAKEQRGQIEGRIMELEEALKTATTIDERQKSPLAADIGDNVTLLDLNSNSELSCMLVSPREADPGSGKISCASPIGKAILGKNRGDIVEVSAPVGKLRYQIKQIN